MEKINIAELLKDCPPGMELDCAIWDNVEFMEVDDENDTIILRVGNKFIRRLNKYGQEDNVDYAKCVIFPKGKTTWGGFVPPCNFKAGDVLVSENGNIVLLSHIDSENVVNYHCIIPTYGSFRIEENTNIGVGRYYECVLANEQQRQRMYDKIKCSGYKYNQSTNKLEKLTEPKFKVGDEIKYKYPTADTSTLTIIKVEYDKNRYVVCDKPNNFAFLSFFAQDNFNFITKTKFDITTLVPFESRVLVRDSNYGIWRVSFWGCLINTENGFNYDTIRGCYKQCIPYEQNEHLLGKTDDCDEFYKTWE